MSKYKDLVAILDGLCKEAEVKFPRLFNSTDPKRKEAARSRAYIHLLLKVRFGLLEADKREYVVTDGTNDGGIDAYFIDRNDRIVYLIQSKFRQNDKIFESREIQYTELLSMDVERIISGNEYNEKHVQYTGKIRRLQREIRELPDNALYTYKVILLANVPDIDENKIKRLIGNFSYEVYDAQRAYDELVFPIVSGTYYKQEQLTITLSLSSESKDHRIEYHPKTANGQCTVNILFVPTQEIGRILNQYKNTILRFNPRSYLGLEENPINANIKKSIEIPSTNEFALLNNGITILSDKAVYSNHVGKADEAKMSLVNPQIINGGQTAYTLSRIYEDAKRKGDFSIFDSKEVLLRVISFDREQIDPGDTEADKKKLKLIEEISNATNQQTEVKEADRRANSVVLVELQKLIFKEFGYYFERKQGEYSDGIAYGYIQPDQVVNKEDFLRCCIAISGHPARARQRSAKMMFRKAEFDGYLPDTSDYKRQMFAYITYLKLAPSRISAASLRIYARYAMVYVASLRYRADISTDTYDTEIESIITEIFSEWNDFEKYAQSLEVNKNRYFKETKDDTTKEILRVDANWQGYYKGVTLNGNLYQYFVVRKQKSESEEEV